ncbi:Hypothetical predicted protein [Olea europaea subsp. europaea]|uniref:Uncharacterized protein n=1 Tax=Olea europaea subsp. europaea TaxID=158383 RepID=A0A8S0SVT1_OLEEU|nr:Hypothetical predicted protein [Olea europaea subsp. europaea]
MVVVIANVRTISRQNATMLRGANVDTVANYETGRITQEIVVPLKGSRATRQGDRPVSSIGLVLRETKRVNPHSTRSSQAPSYCLEQTTSDQLLFRGKSAWTASTEDRR